MTFWPFLAIVNHTRTEFSIKNDLVNERSQFKICLHVTKFSPIFPLNFGPLLFCIREQNFSANGSVTIQSVVQPITIDTVLNNNGLNFGDGLNFVMCKQTFSIMKDIVNDKKGQNIVNDSFAHKPDDLLVIYITLWI